MEYKLDKNELKAYEEDGYLIIRNCLNSEVIDEMMDFTEHLIRLEAGVTSKQYDSNYVLYATNYILYATNYVLYARYCFCTGFRLQSNPR